MCQTVLYQNQKLETPRQLRETLGVEPIVDAHYRDIDEDYCLCQLDLEATLRQTGKKFYMNPDWYGEYLVEDPLPGN